MRIRAVLAALAATATIASCAPRPAPPAPLPPPVPAPRPAPPMPAPTPPPTDWRDAPLARGDWTYSLFDGRPHAQFMGEDGILALRCEASRNVLISLSAASGPSITVRTSYGERRLPATPETAFAEARLPATDPLFDEIAFSRGRFLVQADGAGTLILPAWPEIARVIEECRGQ